MARSSTSRSKNFADYRGDKTWRVAHPTHGSTKVSAPNADAALVAAAAVWGTDWTRISFYAYCEVSRA